MDLLRVSCAPQEDSMVDSAEMGAARQPPERVAVPVMDAPLLFESGMDNICDVTVAVVAPRQRRLQRIMERDQLTEKQAEARMAAQQEEDFYASRASFVIRNDGDLAGLCQQANTLADQVREWSRG